MAIPTTYLIKIDNSPGNITDSEDQHNSKQYSNNTLLPLLPGGGPGDVTGRDGDGPVDVIVDNTEDKERDEDHDDKVSNEYVVSAVAKALSQLGWADGELARYGMVVLTL